jgi:hypothetical protein|eukprot:COSAG01_NODE_2659_length_7299_cov_34.861111_3_plen_77_part_00
MHKFHKISSRSLVGRGRCSLSEYDPLYSRLYRNHKQQQHCAASQQLRAAGRRARAPVTGRPCRAPIGRLASLPRCS